MDFYLTLHNGLQEMGELICPFCKRALEDEKPRDRSVKYYFCCNKQDIINDNGQIVCKNCGIVQGFKYAKEYINFYENRHRFVRKSVYDRKYYIEKRLFDICCKYSIYLTCKDQIKIKKIFSEIGKILDDVNGTRKRMISINFILRKLLNLMNIPCDEIPISKWAKTLAFYNQYWSKIMTIIGDIIKGIIYGGKL